MKKSRGFTLIELLIVTVVIVTLMGIVFRLAGTGSESSARAKTVSRLQKLSNALSGYYAAFGSYPPVPLQGRSRDINTKVNGSKSDASLGYGIQAGSGEALNNVLPGLKDGSADSDARIRRQIEAACRAQPVAAGYPGNPSSQAPDNDILAELAKEYNWKKTYKVISSDGGFERKSTEWSENSIFMFGLMSFLLPRYQFMLDGAENLYVYHQSWLANNRLPFMLNGKRPKNWKTVQDAMMLGPNNVNRSQSPDAAMKAMIENLPSQAVCARWMPNFAGIVATRPFADVSTFFGVDTEAPHDYGNGPGKWFVIGTDGYEGESVYAQKSKTVLDGWGEDFYYYSPPPYQSYQLWSSGPDKRTFPPWYDRSTLDANDLSYVNKWTADDIKVGDK